MGVTKLKKQLLDAANGVDTTNVELAYEIELANLTQREVELVSQIDSLKAANAIAEGEAQRSVAVKTAYAENPNGCGSAVDQIDGMIAAANAAKKATENYAKLVSENAKKVEALVADLAVFRAFRDQLLAEV